MLYNKTSTAFKENSRGQSVGTKSALLGLRTIEPKFFHNIRNSIPEKNKESYPYAK